MKDQLLNKYLEYATTDEAKAVLFVKKYLNQSINHWIDIVYCDHYSQSDDDLHFRIVDCVLYVRKLNPQYVPKNDFIIDGKFDEHKYYIVNRAITWETAHRDIEDQKGKGVIGDKYKINGVRYNKNRGKYRSQPPWLNPDSPFYGDSPSSFRWRERRIYEYEPEWVYEIKSVKKVD